ncbi:MAG: DNA polymerase domain-containing protein [Leptospiraceae bacterium]
MDSSPHSTASEKGQIAVRGWLFDIYHLEDQIYLCILDEQGRFYLCRDHFNPVIYARAPEKTLQKLVQRLHEMDGLHSDPVYVQRKLFYENRMVDVLELRISRPSLLRKIRNRLYAMYGRMDLFHTDFEVPTGYMQQKGIFPLCRLRACLSFASSGTRNAGQAPVVHNLEWIQALDDIFDLNFQLPSVRILRMQLNYGHRLTHQQLLSRGAHKRFHVPDQRIQLECQGRRLDLPVPPGPGELEALNDYLNTLDPDIILSAYGDQVLFPVLFQAYQKYGIPSFLDRDVAPGSSRKIVTEGTSYNTYGNWIFLAPSYPLFGRWHIDSANSFVYKEAQLMGIVELSRMSRIPVQRLSRSSTGAALTAIECEVALRKNYLVPWQKSALEEPRTVMDLLEADKGGLVFVPRAGRILENVAQIDFSQMYPSIMSIHNVSPETINCRCCSDEETEHVPEINFRICKRRRGIVSDALAHILKRRKHYKLRIKELNRSIEKIKKWIPDSGDSHVNSETERDQKLKSLEEEKEMYDHRQSSLKWMLVTSFGYLGYRNAKFGKIESHEAVTAFGRDKLLNAKEIAEEWNYSVVHGITDCLFLKLPDNDSNRPTQIVESKEKREASELQELEKVCEEIGAATEIEMSVEGIYDWVIFLPSRSKPGVEVVNRYFGRFRDGSLRIRGISVRRKDRPSWIKTVQEAFLDKMALCRSAEELKSMHSEMEEIYNKFKEELSSRSIPWTDLLLRRTVSKGLEDYAVDGPAPAALRELEPYGIQVQAGEKVKYIVLEKGQPGASKYMSEEIAFQSFGTDPRKQPPYSIAYYNQLLLDAFREVWEYAAPVGYFQRRDLKQMDLPGV